MKLHHFDYDDEFAARFFKRLRVVDGRISDAAKAFGLRPSTVKSWIKRHPEAKKRYDEVVREVRA
jgi:transposase-like protein